MSDDHRPFRNMPPIGPFIALRGIRRGSGAPLPKESFWAWVVEIVKCVGLTIGCMLIAAVAIGLVIGAGALVVWLAPL